jgi:hypothetical protein
MHAYSFDTRKEIWNKNVQRKFCQESSNLWFAFPGNVKLKLPNIKHVFIAETSDRDKCRAGKQFPTPVTTLQVPMPGGCPDMEKKRLQMPGDLPGYGQC